MNNKLISKIKQSSAKQARSNKVPASQAKLIQQTDALSGFNMKNLDMENVTIYMGDRCVEYAKPNLQGNPQTNIWSVRGEHKERASKDTRFEQRQQQSMQQLMEIFKNMAPPKTEGAAEEVEQKQEE
ncbi:hypothetical protein SS50377_21481 [Spironucleus salmonicida]|uniref:Nascent polypeptide-associated complex subunit beta n=1 Tax=Spironucleus salmonicida TaxID=348837 RepID=V6LQ27_9EUKA|nr:hypothetical protein SS50377_21481 [Spironucleus salmonicida]|eukprot:EST46675.1 hypothetical protein SS50377_13306 [Spironucleus salmonicida]